MASELSFDNKLVGAASPLPVTGPGAAPGSPTYVTAAPITYTDRSGTITTGGTAQQLAAANANRKTLWVHNLSSGDLWINEIGGTAVLAAPSILLPAGAERTWRVGEAPPTAVSIIGATTGQVFDAREG